MKEYFKKYWYVCILVLCIICLSIVTNTSDDEVILEEPEVLSKEEETNAVYRVDIKGEVISPGVYEVSSDKRVMDVITLAGGLTKNADTSLLNLSKKVTDEMNIKVYSKSEVKSAKQELKEVEEIIYYYVDIKGEVKNPGVYKVNSNSRITDVIKVAGGLTKNADTSLLNLSKKVTDEMNIKIYSKEEVENAKKNIEEPKVIEIIKEIEKECVCPDTDCSVNNDVVIDEENNTLNNEDESNENQDNTEIKNSKVNINTATKEDLMTIPNIGESKALSIIEYRNTTKFEKIEDILNVSGIGNTVFEKIKEFITV